MWREIPLIIAVLLAGLSLAQARPSTLSMSCAQASALVASRGAILLSTGRHTYDRFVAGRRFCSLGEYADPAWAPTASGQCRLGYICRPGKPPWIEFLSYP